jgi:uncharacterized repeat protein (TIGR03803 family)
MQAKKCFVALAILTATLFVTRIGATAQVLHSFTNGKDGYSPSAGLIADSAGNLYGTTSRGGTYGSGTVFEVSPKPGGGWTESVLYAFGLNTDGYSPFASLILDASGNLYGTTYEGGIYEGGTAFELSPKSGGGWTETVLHAFGGGLDGTFPSGSLILDAAGNLYGGTYSGGATGGGIVFELTPTGGESWTETVLYAFENGNHTDGFGVTGGLIFDGAGNLYGATDEGGAYGGGTAFELASAAGGVWTETVLHSFGYGGDGFPPVGSLIFDASGNLYGAAYGGPGANCGSRGCGTVFELSRRDGGRWEEKILHIFSGAGGDGFDPDGGLIFDAAGNLYGVTGAGGNITNCEGYGCGTVFELSLREDGSWAEKILHAFKPKNGIAPGGNLIFGRDGYLYGTTFMGTAFGGGTVFAIRP